MSPKADRRFDVETLAALSRINPPDRSAMTVVGARCVGSVGPRSGRPGTLVTEIGVPAIVGAQRDLLADMDLVADALYGRRIEHMRASGSQTAG